MPQRACSRRKADGSPCTAPAVHGKRVCVFHSRGAADARRRGGQNRKAPATTLPEGTPPLRLESVADVTAALGECFNLVRIGRLGVNVGNCLAVIGQGLIKSLEKSELERRISVLEQRANNGRKR